MSLFPGKPTFNFDVLDENKSSEEGVMGVGIGVVVIFSLVSLAVLAVWIAGLVRMGKCGGAKTAFFWATLLLFILVPGPGSIAGFIMSIVALVMLKPGKTALGMSCPSKK